jgi:hypothetical protein
MATPYMVRDIWLAAYAKLRGVPFLGVTRDVRGYAYWNFEHEAMIPVVGEWHAKNATVPIEAYHTVFLELKALIK